MSFLQKYLGDYSSGVANGDLANLANFLPESVETEIANKPDRTNIVSEAPKSGPRSAAAIQREARRRKVVQMMAEDDQPRTYYWWSDTESHPDHVILACAKRGVGTWEMTIPREKWDPMKFLEFVEQIH